MLANLWYKLTGACRHKWETIGGGCYINVDTGRQTGIYNNLRCEYCRKLKEVRTHG